MLADHFPLRLSETFSVSAFKQIQIGLQPTREFGSIQRERKRDGRASCGFIIAGDALSCQVALLLRRSDIEVSPSLCFWCTKFGALHSHMRRTVEKAQALKKLCS